MCVCVCVCVRVCISEFECVFVLVIEKDGRNCGKLWEVTRSVASWEVGSNRVQCERLNPVALSG